MSLAWRTAETGVRTINARTHWNSADPRAGCRGKAEPQRKQFVTKFVSFGTLD
jgi:hypothetical protein